VKGVATAYVTLHVGPGTFRPVKAERLEDHRMHSEWFDIDESTVKKINETRERGGRVIAVGTTAVRTLESAFSDGKVLPKNGFTDIFICPGYRFRLVDCVLTNFHLPKSTLFMLISALVGTDELKRIYAEAVREKYRFFSYGDAMLVV
ncbi:MAG: S-adenosylmethionine:tRNA ribosyltransferase-isomerase, partial [Proteobacteria bacterium]|nr:S-adenosylmethionine:tRNA ribosyltransferase-isomerase [Pseudomonadota bacterium]